jgi:hypothetical protein
VPVRKKNLINNCDKAQHQLDQLNKPDKQRKVVDVGDKGRLYVRDYIKDLDG